MWNWSIETQRFCEIIYEYCGRLKVCPFTDCDSKNTTKNPQGKNTFPFGSMVEHNQKKSFSEYKKVWELYGHSAKIYGQKSSKFFSIPETLKTFWKQSKRVPRTQTLFQFDRSPWLAKFVDFNLD